MSLISTYRNTLPVGRSSLFGIGSNLVFVRLLVCPSLVGGLQGVSHEYD